MQITDKYVVVDVVVKSTSARIYLRDALCTFVVVVAALACSRLQAKITIVPSP